MNHGFALKCSTEKGSLVYLAIIFDSVLKKKTLIHKAIMIFIVIAIPKSLCILTWICHSITMRTRKQQALYWSALHAENIQWSVQILGYKGSLLLDHIGFLIMWKQIWKGAVLLLLYSFFKCHIYVCCLSGRDLVLLT